MIIWVDESGVYLSRYSPSTSCAIPPVGQSLGKAAFLTASQLKSGTAVGWVSGVALGMGGVAGGGVGIGSSVAGIAVSVGVGLTDVGVLLGAGVGVGVVCLPQATMESAIIRTSSTLLERRFSTTWSVIMAIILCAAAA